MSRSIDWEGKSGKKYTYEIYEIGTSFKEKPGNYIYAKQTESRRWKPVYIGQTKNLSERLASHEKEKCATRNGATHVHIHVSGRDQQVRLDEEADLIERWGPACND